MDEEFVPEEMEEYNHAREEQDHLSTVKPVKRIVKTDNSLAPSRRSKPLLWGVSHVSDLEDIIME